VSKDPSALKYADATLRSDKGFVKAAVSKNGCVLGYVDDALRSDAAVVMAAVSKHPSALEYADVTLRSDKDFVKAAVGKNGRVLEYVDDAFRSDAAVVMAAVTADPLAFNFASGHLRAQQDVVQTALRNNSAHDDACPRFLVFAFRVTTLAGNSCSLVFPGDKHDLHEALLELSARALSLDVNLVLAQGELIDVKSAKLLPHDEFLGALDRFALNELQLVLATQEVSSDN